MHKILVVEDQADIRHLLQLALTPDYEVHEAADGDSGLAAAMALAPDVVLLDVMMPGMLNGFDVCRCIRADPSLQHTKVVMLTARGQARDREAGLASGAHGYLVKPFSLAQVMATLVQLAEPGAPLAVAS